ncbi:MAG TPA: hypothetical protein VHT21_00225 [Stellaceae bacterium]|nr:hypothetical protein [Stellaceae bacterium]
MIGCDAGSTDPGPGPLATGTCMFSAAAVKRDTEIMVTRAIKAGIPLIIGSAGTSGSDAGLAWMVDIVRGIVREQNLHFKLAVIHSELSREVVRRHCHNGSILSNNAVTQPDAWRVTRRHRSRHRLSYLPRHWDHRLPGQWRRTRTCPGNGRA